MDKRRQTNHRERNRGIQQEKQKRIKEQEETEKKKKKKTEEKEKRKKEKNRGKLKGIEKERNKKACTENEETFREGSSFVRVCFTERCICYILLKYIGIYGRSEEEGKNFY